MKIISNENGKHERKFKQTTIEPKDDYYGTVLKVQLIFE